jgi:hypothetical protein
MGFYSGAPGSNLNWFMDYHEATVLSHQLPSNFYVFLALSLRSLQVVFLSIAADQQTVCPSKHQTVR